MTFCKSIFIGKRDGEFILGFGHNINPGWINHGLYNVYIKTGATPQIVIIWYFFTVSPQLDSRLGVINTGLTFTINQLRLGVIIPELSHLTINQQ